MTKLVLHGTIHSDQHEQGYLGPITMTLTMPSSGQITSRKDSAALADSNFDIKATIEIPNAFGTPTTLHTAVPINFLAREIARFPALGSSYQYRGTQPPISLVDSTGTEQGQALLRLAEPDGRATTSATTPRPPSTARPTSTPTATASSTRAIPRWPTRPIILQQIAEISGPTGEEGSGGENGSGGPPEGKGERPEGPPITIYTDANGLVPFQRPEPRQLHRPLDGRLPAVGRHADHGRITATRSTR